jgi:hypothetical protein
LVRKYDRRIKYMPRKKGITGFKGFDPKFQCRGFQFEPGKSYKHDGDVKVCESGFHFCENPLDIFNYYPPADTRFAEVEGKGDTAKHSDDSKVACSELHVKAEVSLNTILSASVKFILDKVSWKKAPATNTGNRSAATNTGDQSAATNTGDWSTATNTGYQSAATVEGKESVACALGIEGKARGNIGCWLVLTEWIHTDAWHIKGVKAVLVDGETIKAGVFYILTSGQIVEAA